MPGTIKAGRGRSHTSSQKHVGIGGRPSRNLREAGRLRPSEGNASLPATRDLAWPGLARPVTQQESTIKTHNLTF